MRDNKKEEFVTKYIAEHYGYETDGKQVHVCGGFCEVFTGGDPRAAIYNALKGEVTRRLNNELLMMPEEPKQFTTSDPEKPAFLRKIMD